MTYFDVNIDHIKCTINVFFYDFVGTTRPMSIESSPSGQGMECYSSHPIFM
jgi:hypothetical protein